MMAIFEVNHNNKYIQNFKLFVIYNYIIALLINFDSFHVHFPFPFSFRPIFSDF
jgi:hypothetical protein